MKNYLPDITNKKEFFWEKVVFSERYEIFRWIVEYRLVEHYTLAVKQRKNMFNKVLLVIHTRRMNRFASHLGFMIPIYTLGEGVIIHHRGNVIINPRSRLGKGCELHGDNCIGNNGLVDKAPVIGDYVNIGIGAKIIGDIFIADNTVIGANSVVNKSNLISGAVIAGVPVKRIDNKL